MRVEGLATIMAVLAVTMLVIVPIMTPASVVLAQQIEPVIVAIG